MRLRLGMSIVGITVLVGTVQPSAAKRAAVEACLTIKAGKTVTLQADVTCHQSGTPPAGAVGVNMASNTTLDCNGFKIIGPNITYTPNAEEYHGIYAQKRRKVTVKNCRVEKYTRGLQFDEVKSGRVFDNHFDGNNRYGAALINKASFDNLWERNTYNQNGDEGLHLSGEFKKGATKPNKFLDSLASGNVKEGWYLLNANYVEISGVETASGLAADNNGQPGFYIKHSHHNKIQNTKMYRDVFKITGESDSNTISNVTVVKGQVQIHKYVDTDVTPNVTYYPDHNTLAHVCVRHESGTPSTGFDFVGATDGYNTITNSETILANTSADPVKATETTTHNSVVDLYISPSGMTNDIEAGSSFDTLTMQTTTPPTCYGD